MKPNILLGKNAGVVSINYLYRLSNLAKSRGETRIARIDAEYLEKVFFSCNVKDHNTPNITSKTLFLCHDFGLEMSKWPEGHTFLKFS